MNAPPQAALRPPAQVMRLARLGALHPSRLSFIPALLREFRNGKWTFTRTRWEMDERGVGVGVYRARRGAGEEIYSLVAFGHDLPPAQRSDRVIATSWDATFVLCEGEPGDADLARLRNNVPKQEAGRCGPGELVLSRANKSVRVFQNLIDALRAGRTPDRNELESTGYLMRTTAVYGNGKFGLADRDPQAHPALRAPFRAELLAVFLIRAFTFDWAEHIGGGAIPKDLKRMLGVGNSTGLGMAPFLVNHPLLLHRWIWARETALARVRAAPITPISRTACLNALRDAEHNAEHWLTDDTTQAARIKTLRTDLQQAIDFAGEVADWSAMIHWSEQNLSAEGQEALVSAMLQPHGALVDDLTEHMDADEDAYLTLNGEETLAAVRARIERDYVWALGDDYAADDARFWYVSEEKLEPRLGCRAREAGAEWELPLAVARDIRALYRQLKSAPDDEPLGHFLARHPARRGAARRSALAARFPYMEIRENLISAQMRPIDMLRCKLSFFGATRFDPKSDKWLRINLFAGAPLPCCFDPQTPPACAGCPHRQGG